MTHPRINVISRRVRVTIVTVGKAISITYYLALVIQHAMRMHRIILSYVLSGCSIFFHISHKRYDFWKKILLNTKFLF
jgi:hypothetical protein